MVRPKAASRLAVVARVALALGSELPHLVEILAAIGLERDQGAGVGDAGQPSQPSGHHLGQLFDLAHPDDSDDVGVAGYRVGLCDPLANVAPIGLGVLNMVGVSARSRCERSLGRSVA
jgi:hypothetical protein